MTKTFTQQTLNPGDYIFSGNHNATKKNVPMQYSPQSYYRPLTFQVITSINPLVAAAAPLLTLNARLKNALEYQNIDELYQHLIHEIKAFETNARKQDYRSETILIARYILCSTLDETICQSSWGKEKEWQANQLLKNFQVDEQADERFFIILEKIIQDARYHLDLLELSYILLRFGFEGKYRDDPLRKSTLDRIVDDLYHQIQIHRAELSTFLLDKKDVTTQAKPFLKRFSIKIPILFLALTCFVTLATTEYAFTSQSKPLVNSLFAINAMLKKHG